MPTAVELMALPEYCQAKLGTDSRLHEEWRQRMGPQFFLHVHHFCHGLKYMRRAAQTVDLQKQRYKYQLAIGEFDYVIRNWPAEFPLRTQALQQQRMAQTMLGRP